MTNKQKIKGSRWERDATKELSKNAETSKRIPGSGAIGTTIKDPRLTGDNITTYKFLNKPMKIEMKYGYGGSKQMTIYREWMEKIRQEAKNNNSIPAVMIKFKDVTGGDIESAKWICFSLEDWQGIVSYLNELFEDFEEFWRYKYEQPESQT